MRATAIPLLLLAALCLSACESGRYEGTAAATDVAAQGSGSFANDRAFFDERVAPRLSFCRTCHVPDGVADTDEGDRFLLSKNAADDYDNLFSSWKLLGEGVDDNLLLIEATDNSEPHSGGKPWPRGSDAYADMRSLLRCWAGIACDFSGDISLGEDFPLLGSRRGGHVWEDFCAAQADNATLPTDPRSLVLPGANADKAVFFNAWYQDCHVNAPEQEREPKTCGEYKARRDRGKAFLLDELPVSAMSAEDYDNSWQKWGLEQRPDNLTEMYTLRYGMNNAPFDNPYPLPGEDPNSSNGGSGQLPIGLRQMKDADGNWTGDIGSAACFFCHGGQIGDPKQQGNLITEANIGLGNNNYDVLMNSRDSSPWTQAGPVAEILPAMDINTLFNIGIKQRGQNNAVGAFEFLVTLLDYDSLGVNPNPLKTITPGGVQGVVDVSHPLAHTQDTPPWWNIGSRPRKFFDAGTSMDSTRIIMAAGPGELDTIFSQDGKPYRDRIEEYDQDLAAYFLSLRSPAYPQEIDESLAEQGAVLFHTKDLWSEDGNVDHPKPLGGNGSCASCHGAYSPRYVNDPSYLEHPRWDGVAAHISPLEVIGTDTARSDMLTPTLREGWDTTYWGYTDGVEGFVPPDEKDPATELLDDLLPSEQRPQGVCGWEKSVIGYQAPPLHGVWATAPYLHNGSVPTLEQVLNSETRPEIWQRKLQTMDGVVGYDQSLSAYDFTAIGWQHEALDCSDIPGTELLNCNPIQEQGPSGQQLIQNLLNQTLSWAGLLTIPDPDPAGFDKRLIYDGRILGNSPQGHQFTDVLTQRERAAVIEYLKTL
ncbi:MAG: putative rubber dioxygenase RoxC [Oceanococcus sp.]